jgi:transcriptional regulator with XRE-family HTH domain
MIEIKRITSASARIKEAMLLTEKTRVDLVRETGLNKSTISRYLSGEIEPKQIAISKLASSLGVDEMWLWGYDVPMKKKAATQKDSGMSKAKRELLALAESCTDEEASRLLQMVELFLGKR